MLFDRLAQKLTHDKSHDGGNGDSNGHHGHGRHITSHIIPHSHSSSPEVYADETTKQKRPSARNPHRSNKPLTSVYFANWSIYERKHFPIDIDFNVVDHVYYAFLLIDESTGNVDFLDTWADLEIPLPSPLDPQRKVRGLVQQFQELKKLHKHLTISFSIGGWGTLTSFEKIVLKRSLYENFINSCCNLVEKYGFDGIDIDWEYPQSTHHNKMFCQMLTELNMCLSDLNQKTYLSIAAPAGFDNIDKLQVAEIDEMIDYWNIMCYDFTGFSWSSKIGFHCNLFGNNGDNDLNGDDVIKQYIRRGATAHKLVLGIPLYGRKFEGVETPMIGESFDKSKVKDEGILEYKTIIKTFKNEHEHFDYRKVGVSRYDPESKVFITFDNPHSVKVKAQYIKLHGLGGGMFWDTAGDCSQPEKSVIQAFSHQLRS